MIRGVIIMAKRNVSWTKEKRDRYIKGGRGRGEGKDYMPWWTVQDFPTLGRATRIMGYKTGRLHHFLSDLQLKYFYLLEWEDRVVDIREHYPLLDIEEILINNSDLKFHKFMDKDSKEPYVFCTSFLITISGPNKKKMYIARSLKNASELCRKITLEKLEIERRYWEYKGIDWGIVTNKNINNTRTKNIEWLHSVLIDTDINGLTKEEVDVLSQELFRRLIYSKNTIRKIIYMYEKDYFLDAGTGVLLFKYLLTQRKIIVDMDKPIDLNSSSTSLLYS